MPIFVFREVDGMRHARGFWGKHPWRMRGGSGIRSRWERLSPGAGLAPEKAEGGRRED